MPNVIRTGSSDLSTQGPGGKWMMLALAISLALAPDALLLHSRGILLIAIPLLILIATVLPYASRRYLLDAGMLLLLLQTATLFHPSFGKGGGLILESRIIFVGLVSIYLCILLLPRALRQPDRRLFSTAMLLAFLLFYAAGAVILSGAENSGISNLLPGVDVSMHAGQPQ